MPTASLAGRCATAVMAKAPRPGAVKTRLVPPLTGEEAMGLSAAFLRDITENIGCAGARAPIAGYLAYAPAGTEDRFAGALAPVTGLVLADGAVGDMPRGVTGIGRSLLHATRGLLALGATAVCLVNADSPTLPTSILVRAAEILLQPGDRMVLGPADDGGYYLIGLKAPHAHLFADITWSTPDVAAATVARAAGLGLEVTMLPGWYDVDDAASLFRLRRQMAAGSAASSGDLLPFPAPATAAFLSQLDLTGRSGLGAAMPA